MKIQASLEFILILSALSILSVSVVTLYGKAVFAQNKLLQESGNALAFNIPVLHNSTQSTNPSAFLYMPVNSTVGKSSHLQITFFNCSNGTAIVSLNSTSLLFANERMAVDIEGFGMASVPFTPMTSGKDTAIASYSVSCNGYEDTRTYPLSTFALPSQAQQNLTFYSATISSRNESVVYRIDSINPVVNLTQSTFCTQYDFWYHPLPITVQCGTLNAWEYIASKLYYCPWTTTTCIWQHQTRYNLTSTDQANFTYSYSFYLSVSTPYGTMRSNLSNKEGSTPVILNNVIVGHAEVVSVSSAPTPQDPNLLLNGSSYKAVGGSTYSEYDQARNNLFSTLAFYNRTESYSPQIDEALYAYNQSLKGLINGTSKSTVCSSAGDLLYCKPELPFTYAISILVNGTFSGGNTTVFFSGSEVNVTHK